MLQNWRSASNAEMFPAGFRALGLGKVVGTPTMGAVIGTGSYSLIDGSSIRTPGVGVFLADTARTNMENHAVQPDVYVENTPEDNLAGRDRQLETAVREVMKDLKPSRVGRQERQGLMVAPGQKICPGKNQFRSLVTDGPAIGPTWQPRLAVAFGQ